MEDSNRHKNVNRSLQNMECASLTKPIFSLDLVLGEAADSGQRASTVCDGDRHHDFIGARRVVDANFHAIEVTADKSRVLVAEGNVEDHAHSAALLGGGNQRRAFAEHSSNRSPQLRMQNGGSVLKLSVFA